MEDNEKIRILEKQIENLEDEIYKLEEDLTNAEGSTEIEELENEIEDAYNKIERLEEDLSKTFTCPCPICGSPILNDVIEGLICSQCRQVYELKEKN